MADQLHTHAEASRFAASAPSVAWLSGKCGETVVVGVAHSPVAVTSRAVSNLANQSHGIHDEMKPAALIGGFDAMHGEGVLRGGGRAGL